MADNSYNIEIKPVSKNGYFTPAESRSYYGKYSRDVYIVHWWGNGQGASGHDGIVNYIHGTAAAGNMSVNYVLSDVKMTMLVNPDNVSWGAQGGNPIGTNTEHQPTLGAEGYKKSGWLKEQLEQRWGKRLAIRGHNAYYATQCPGTISLDRIEQECDKWRRRVYDQPAAPAPPPPPPAPPKPSLIVVDDADKVMFTLNNAKLVNFDGLSVVKTFPLDTPMEVSQKVRYNNMEFYRTVSATNQSRMQGFLVGDLKPGLTPPPTQPEPPKPVPPASPDWVKNLRDIDDTEFWFTKDTELIDITTGKPTGTKTFKKDESFVASALTASSGTEYRITDYSFKKGIFNGVPISNLTLTKPGVPNIPPVPSVEERLSWLEKAVKAILAVLNIKV